MIRGIIRELFRVSLMANLLFVFFVLSCNAISRAQEDEEPEIIVETKKITGQVSALTSRFIAVVYDKKGGTEYEMALPMEEGAEIERKDTLDEINLGDTVTVTYEELQQKRQDPEEGERLMIIARKATVITFVRPAIKESSGQGIWSDPISSGSGYDSGTLRSFEKIKGYKEE